MPFRSKAQRRWMHANKPAMASRWEKETPSETALPEHAAKKGKIKRAYQSAGFPNAAGPEDWDSVGDSPWKQGEPKVSKDKLDEKEKASQGDDLFGGDGTQLMPHLRAIHKMGHIKQAMPYSLQKGLIHGGVGALLGAATGAPIGALAAGEGKRGKGALRGAAIGGATGGLAGFGSGIIGGLASLPYHKRMDDLNRLADSRYDAATRARVAAHDAGLFNFGRADDYRRLLADEITSAQQAGEALTAQAGEYGRKSMLARRIGGVGGLVGGGLLGGGLAHLATRPSKEAEKTAEGEFEFADLGPSSSADLAGPKIWKMPGKFKRSAGLDQEYPQVEDGEKGYDAPVTLQGAPGRAKVASIVHIPRESYVALLDELGRPDGPTQTYMEKEAVDPLTMAALGAASHVGVNLAVKAGHHTRLLKNVRAGRLAAGIREAIEGKAQGLGSRMAETWMGPELIAPEHVGRVVGSSLRGQSTGQRYRALKKLRKAVAMSPELQKAPVLEDIVGGVNRTLATPLPKPGAIQKPSFLQRVLPKASMVGAAVTYPEAAVHAGINTARKAVATSDAGKEFMGRQFIQGALHGAPSRTSAALMDTLISPAALNTRRIGEAVANTALNEPAQAKRFAGALHSIAGPGGVQSGIEAGKQKIQGAVQRLKERVAPLPAVNPSTYGIPRGVRM